MRLFGWTIARQKTEQKALQPVGNHGGWLSLIREPFAGAWQRDITIRVENVLTYTAVFSCISLIANDYSHCEREMALGASSGGSLVDLFKGLAATTVDGVLNASLMDEIWKHVLGLVNAHFMENYRKLIDKAT